MSPSSNPKNKELTEADIIRTKAEILFHYRGAITLSDMKKMHLAELLEYRRNIDKLLASERFVQWMITVYPLMAGNKNEEYEQALWEMIDPDQRSSDNREQSEESIKMRERIDEINRQSQFKQADQTLRGLFGKK